MICFIAGILIMLTVQAQSADFKESAPIAEAFSNVGINGTFVLYDVTNDTYTGHDKTRAETPFIPASTFKIPNTLIGLSVGAVTSVDEVLPYTGPEKPFIPEWKKDMGLRQAIAMSNLPIYQELARRIGLERMKENIIRMNYGNREIGETVDTFWLAGPLKISAMEQAQFLARLGQGTLPFSKDSQESVRTIIRLDQGTNWTLYGKTGWQNAPESGIGWWVGWVEKDGSIYSFALNMDMRSGADGPKRIELGKTCLKILGIL